MKVKRLIALLEKMPQGMEVRTEGCDCIGGVGGVTLWSKFHVNPGKEEFVLVTRPKEE